MYLTANIWICYGAYIAFIALYNFVITVTQWVRDYHMLLLPAARVSHITKQNSHHVLDIVWLDEASQFLTVFTFEMTIFLTLYKCHRVTLIFYMWNRTFRSGRFRLADFALYICATTPFTDYTGQHKISFWDESSHPLLILGRGIRKLVLKLSALFFKILAPAIYARGGHVTPWNSELNTCISLSITYLSHLNNRAQRHFQNNHQVTFFNNHMFLRPVVTVTFDPPSQIIWHPFLGGLDLPKVKAELLASR